MSVYLKSVTILELESEEAAAELIKTLPLMPEQKVELHQGKTVIDDTDESDAEGAVALVHKFTLIKEK